MMKMSATLTPRALLRLFPNASKSTFAANFTGSSSGRREDFAASIPHSEPERIEAKTLERGDEGKEESAGRAHLRITRFGSRLLDADNLAGGAKPLIDCLKEAGLIKDDSPEWLTLEMKQEKVPAGCERTELEITWETAADTAAATVLL